MTRIQLARRGLVYHWRTNLAATVGLAIAVATLAGAHNVGESVRKSLRELVAARLGSTQFAVTSATPFREELLPQCPLLALEAVVIHEDNTRRASRVALYAVDQRFFEFHQRAMQAPGPNEFLLSDTLASELAAKPDDRILVRVPRNSAIPAESLHGQKDDPGRTIRGAMRSTISRTAMGEFSLRPQQGPVRAIFVNLRRFQHDLELDGQANLALTRQDPTQQVRSTFQLADVGLRIREGMVEHASMVLRDDLVAAVKKADPNAQPVLTYLANTIRAPGAEIPYSTVTAIEGIQAGEIRLNEWAARELRPKPGDRIDLEYYVWDPSGRLVTKSSSFRYAGSTPIEPWQRNLAPEYPGITDAPSISDWDPPFPMDLGRIRKADEDYWDRHRATPKAFLSLADGQRLWRTRYGAVTALRSNASAAQLRSAIDPLSVIQVQNVRAQNTNAAQGATDFGEYFLYFSFFLVIAALLLVGLFFRFGIEQRLGEIATLRALGWSIGQIRSVLLTEGLAVAAVGSVVGALGALAYSKLVLYGLRTWWVDAVGTRDLRLAISSLSLSIGIAAGLAMAVIVIMWSLARLGRHSPQAKPPAPRRQALRLLVAVGPGIALLFVGGAGGFFGAGFFFLISTLIAIRWFLQSRRVPLESVNLLGLRYAGYRAGRAALCVGLIASATFLVIAVDAFRRHAGPNAGEYAYFGETAIPVFYDPNTSDGKEALNLREDSRWISFRLRPGEDASCLNLYEPQNPRVIGAPPSWLKIESTMNDGTFPAAVDANTLTYVLHRKLGDVITVGGARLRLVQTLQDSVFQSEIVMSDADFQRAFPEEQGFRVFLVSAPPNAEGTIETALADYGMDITSVAERIAAYHRVENAYLSTFQSLGALGLLLGTAGLSAVVMRNVLERRKELALLRANGFATSDLSSMLLAENLTLLVVGLVAGILSAAIAVLPVVMARGGSAPWKSLAGMLGAVLLCGVLSTLIGVRQVTRSSLLSALRSE